MLGTKIITDKNIDNSYYQNIGVKICNQLNLNNESTMFIFGSSVPVSKFKKLKFKQTRYFDSLYNLKSIKYERIYIYPDLDLRIITCSRSEDLRKKAVSIIKSINSKILIELKIDDILYPTNDIKNTKITSFFRRVLALSNTICLNNTQMLNQLIEMSKKCVTDEDITYDYERKMVNAYIKEKLLLTNEFWFNEKEIQQYPTYFNSKIIRNEMKLRNNSILIKNNDDLTVWDERQI